MFWCECRWHKVNFTKGEEQPVKNTKTIIVSSKKLTTRTFDRDAIAVASMFFYPLLTKGFLPWHLGDFMDTAHSTVRQNPPPRKQRSSSLSEHYQIWELRSNPLGPLRYLPKGWEVQTPGELCHFTYLRMQKRVCTLNLGSFGCFEGNISEVRVRV